jgi:hypothetical protein
MLFFTQKAQTSGGILRCPIMDTKEGEKRKEKNTEMMMIMMIVIYFIVIEVQIEVI